MATEIVHVYAAPVSDPGPVRRLFDVWSRFYDLPVLSALTYGRAHSPVVAALRKLEPSRDVLDVGCGTGVLAHRLAREFADVRVTGCDLSRQMLRRARTRDRTPSWIQGDALHLPFRDGCFDAAVCTAAFHWFPDQRKALRELRRVLRPGPASRLFIVLVHPRFAALGDAIRLALRATGQPSFWPTTERLRRDIESSGLHVERQERIPGIPTPPLLPAILTVAVRGPDDRRARRA